jgi:hypothetical protein
MATSFTGSSDAVVGYNASASINLGAGAVARLFNDIDAFVAASREESSHD